MEPNSKSPFPQSPFWFWSQDGGAGNSEEKGEEWKRAERRGDVMMIKINFKRDKTVIILFVSTGSEVLPP